MFFWNSLENSILIYKLQLSQDLNAEGQKMLHRLFFPEVKKLFRSSNKFWFGWGVVLEFHVKVNLKYKLLAALYTFAMLGGILLENFYNTIW